MGECSGRRLEEGEILFTSWRCIFVRADYCGIRIKPSTSIISFPGAVDPCINHFYAAYLVTCLQEIICLVVESQKGSIDKFSRSSSYSRDLLQLSIVNVSTSFDR